MRIRRTSTGELKSRATEAKTAEVAKTQKPLAKTAEKALDTTASGRTGWRKAGLN